ncbi:hypothetical protein IFM89_014410 [Coptis chinensis]|uniref:Protein kinase domain-containing protein n=1 Tax=Coptis chinensis TaxID=261450 RepID=A0A835I2B3_9MAGN|nr:hypothetical protein IFM89_014410 [Coptis chinensis]
MAKLRPTRDINILSWVGAQETPDYIAPKVSFRNFGGVSHMLDVYSYGMMVLEMIGSSEMFEEETTRPTNRPSMSDVVEMLEGNNEELQMPPNPSVFFLIFIRELLYNRIRFVLLKLLHVALVQLCLCFKFRYEASKSATIQ